MKVKVVRCMVRPRQPCLHIGLFKVLVGLGTIYIRLIVETRLIYHLTVIRVFVHRHCTMEHLVVPPTLMMLLGLFKPMDLIGQRLGKESKLLHRMFPSLHGLN